MRTDIVRFCAEECYRQQSGEISVANMVDAYQAAMDCYEANTKQIEPWLIKWLGKLIEPNLNRDYRQVPVTLNEVAIPHKTIEKNIKTLCTLQVFDYDAEMAIEFYHYFEKIHPFEDGNGRVGAILFNWINGTLYSPVTPPNVWEGAVNDA